MSKKILITGAAGFIGRQLSDFFEKKKIDTIDVDNLSAKPLLKPKNGLIIKNVEQITADFLKKNSVHKIIHLAAKKSVDQSFINLKHSPYAVSKVANEYLCNIFLMRKPSMKITSLIFFNTFGPTEGRDAVIPKFINLLNKNKSLNIEGDGSQSRDFTFIDDTILALYKIIQSKKYFRQINIGSGKNTTIKELVSMLKIFYPKLKVNYVKSRVNEIKAFNANISLLRKEYKFKNSFNIIDGIKKTIKDF